MICNCHIYFWSGYKFPFSVLSTTMVSFFCQIQFLSHFYFSFGNVVACFTIYSMTFIEKNAASSPCRMKTMKKNKCLVFGVFWRGFNYHLKYLNNVHLCKKSPHKSGDFFMHKEENIWTFVYWLKSLKGRQCNYWNETNWWCYCTTGLSVELSSIFNWNSCILHVAKFMWYFHCSICRILIVFR